MNGIADTGFLAAFINRGDKYHDWALDVARQLDTPFLTCESVLSETAFHTDAQYVFNLLNSDMVVLAFACKEHLSHLETLAKAYSHHKPDFADLRLVRMSELFPKHPVITVDRGDFRVYRRNKRDVIPLICPPDL